MHKDLKRKSFANIQELFDKAMKMMNTFVDYRTELVEGSSEKAEAEIAQESSSKRAGDELEQESIKKQKVDEDTETAELQSLMQVIPDEEEVAIDAIPLATKPPTIVDWKIHKEGKNSYYQIIRADGSSKMYMVFSLMLKSFDSKIWKICTSCSFIEDATCVHSYAGRKEISTYTATITDMLNKKLLLEVTTAQVRVTAAKQNLVLLSNLNEKYAK
ncbi:hypothetical protein Tco_1087336 [Tanacetum coccineum]